MQIELTGNIQIYNYIKHCLHLVNNFRKYDRQGSIQDKIVVSMYVKGM